MSKKYKYIGDPEECFICKKRYGLEKHHIFNGPYKKASEKYGLLIRVCADCHTLAPGSIHRDSTLKKKLKIMGQKIFEQTHTREEFIKEFDQSFIL